ncbi:uncharacterized protein K460DRAFT_360968 [Cucurbitaria berberidis CBS 394.84]|uniref:Uncharacterized protein n=1 Tax=Cucurbitaria berberidis CBS 394.84 TaxID=1168544 RepID=A0A9P4GRU1_9PLEO|nr:uncharacterized protein K460DRAFT_360968 [Cucurbitaria berberidis CBS 394.84]KAF1850119.1 hypothetical protein K460DRAFT_360968 [Cucurbitaria berberidis CBS 394.84]
MQKVIARALARRRQWLIVSLWTPCTTVHLHAHLAHLAPSPSSICEGSCVPLTVSLPVPLACRPRSHHFAGAPTALANGTIRNRFSRCVSLVPRVGMAALVAPQVVSHKGPASVLQVVSRVGAESLIQ